MCWSFAYCWIVFKTCVFCLLCVVHCLPVYCVVRHSIVNTLRGEERGNTDGTDIQLPDEMSRRLSFPTVSGCGVGVTLE